MLSPFVQARPRFVGLAFVLSAGSLALLSAPRADAGLGAQAIGVGSLIYTPFPEGVSLYAIGILGLLAVATERLCRNYRHKARRPYFAARTQQPKLDVKSHRA